MEAVADGESGILVDNPEDPEAVAKTIRRLLSDDALCKRMGEAGRSRVKANYDWRLLADQLSEIL